MRHPAVAALALAVALPEIAARELLRLAEILYPDLFRHGYRREAAEFYRRFHHQAPSEAQVTRLLGEPGASPR